MKYYYNAELYRGSRTFNGIARLMKEHEYAYERRTYFFSRDTIELMRRAVKKTVFNPPIARAPSSRR